MLKDASSTAIYGSRGANGVVLITTKSGEKGKVNVNYNVYWGFKDIARKNQVQALNPSEFARWQYELAAIQNRFRTTTSLISERSPASTSTTA